MNLKLKILIGGLGVVVVGLLAILVFVPSPKKIATVPPVVDTPQPAISSDGHVEVGAPLANEVIASPVRIAGNVTGGEWFFEGSFPVKIVDADGIVLGRGTAHATGDWMTTDTVPFSATISFSTPESATGVIVLSKDNPSGLPANNLSLSIPIEFSISTTTLPILDPKPSSTPPAFNNDSGIKGTVTLGPTCPVEKNPPDPQCAPKPYVTRIYIYKANSTEVIATAATDAWATYTAVLPAGDYLLAPQGGNPLPRCAPVEVHVSSGKFTNADLTCDTGIR